MKASEMELSIIIPAYNCREYIGECIAALLDQDMENYEIIIIDDGSTDETASYCNQLAASEPKIRVIHKENEGQGIARNRGIQIAKGQFIAFVDADDLPYKRVYGRVIEEMKKQQIDLGVCNWTRGTGDTKCPETHETDRELLTITAAQAIENMAAEKGFLGSAVWNKIYRRNILLERNIFFVSERTVISEDFLFNWDYIHAAGLIVMMNINLYHYRINVGSFCHSYQRDYFSRMVNLKNELKKRNLNIEEEKAVRDKLYSFIKTCIIQEVKFEPYKKAVAAIKEICEAQETKEICRSIDICQLDRSNKPIGIFIRTQAARMLYVLYKFKR